MGSNRCESDETEETMYICYALHILYSFMYKNDNL